MNNEKEASESLHVSVIMHRASLYVKVQDIIAWIQDYERTTGGDLHRAANLGENLKHVLSKLKDSL